MPVAADKKSSRKKKNVKDPHQAREAAKYENPIPSREFILELLEKRGTPLLRKEIAEALAITDEEQLEALRRRLRAMERDGQLLRNRRDRYCLINSKDLVKGTVIGHPDGFGFLKPDEGGDDLFLSPREMRSLLHNDRIVARVSGIDHRGRREGALVEVLERNTHQVVGRFYRDSGVAVVVPDSKHLTQDILIPEKSCGDAQEGQIVVAEIVEQPNRRSQPTGRVMDVLGDHMAPGMEIEVAIRAHELPSVWPADVLKEAAKFGKRVPQKAKEGRTDLRDTHLVTIDGEDARDFDDAVYCEAKPSGWKLLVAIADVSHYVKPGSALDTEARNRGNSVYFPQRVIPMLPEELSNGLCSLNPDVDRLAMVCEMLINREGQVTRSRFYDAVIRSHARLTYTDVARMLQDGKKPKNKTQQAALPHLQELYRLFQVLRQSRDERGAIDFDTEETRVVFGEGKKIERIVPTERNDAHRLIEECMITANMAAARFLVRRKMPYLLRTHQGPSAEKLEALRTFVGEIGLSLGGGDKPTPLDYMALLNQIEGRGDQHLIQTVLLRSLSQAVYSAEKGGHFGLSLDLYTHFTSPIRRYPDLMVHRAIRHCLTSNKPEEFRYAPSDMAATGEHCSITERRADDATRDVMSWLKCEYMLDKVGEQFDGVISAVTGFGLFVELKGVFVEGLVHITSLGKDYFHFDPVAHRLSGERSGVNYRLGDTLTVVVARVDLDERKIDFELPQRLEPETEPESRPKKKRRSRKRKAKQ